jgi:hypothetical protein
MKASGFFNLPTLSLNSSKILDSRKRKGSLSETFNSLLQMNQSQHSTHQTCLSYDVLLFQVSMPKTTYESAKLNASHVATIITLEV